MTAAQPAPAPDAPDTLRERVAVALYEATEGSEYADWPDLNDGQQTAYLALADAALVVLPDTSALARVEALADELVRDVWNITADPVTRERSRIGARIRAAIRGPK